MNEHVIASRLQTALAERDRLTHRYQSAVGTNAELTAYARLQAANLAVANADRIARATRLAERHPTP